MEAPAGLDGLLAEDKPVRAAAGQPRILSALAPGEEGAAYDRHAAVYDRVIGNPLYNRVVWSCPTSEYAEFAREALAAGDGPFLDAGCGTLVFTGDVYAA